MLKLIVGLKGSGKTKTLIELANNAIKESKGSVVCIEKGGKLKFDLNHEARLIDTAEYDINSAASLYGLVCGLYAENYDITHVFIDSALKICENKVEEFAEFIKSVDKLAKKNEFEIIITSSIDKAELPAEISSFVI